MNKKIKCDIYTRVSTTMQVDGYSLDAQKEKLKRYAEFQNMEIVNEYSDEGKSGKSVEGRPEFQRMLDNIENGTDEVQFVLVFKLSRFGRNAADVLNSLQRMQDFGVNLICVEDGIDSSKDSGKLMISVLSAVAEIERENILVQTMEGRKQKAREGKWNGGFAPYGYELVNGELQIAEDEAEIIRLIYDKFIHTNMGISAIAAWLNQHGYKKKKFEERIHEEHLENLLEVHLLDYRDLPKSKRKFDRIVSVGMLEHVGRGNYEEFMSCVKSVLKPGGLFLLHYISALQEHPGDAWIKKYIFPGGVIPSLREIIQIAGDMRFYTIDVESLRRHYNKTLLEWNKNFQAHRAEVVEMFDEKFARMWELYLCACAATFQNGIIDLSQILFTNDVNNDLPMTRWY